MSVSRFNDLSFLDDAALQRMAQAVAGSGKRVLHNTFANAQEARIAAQELRVQGLEAHVEGHDDHYRVYSVAPVKVAKREAEASGAFKALGYGYYAFQRDASLEMHSYNFDDGTVWRVAQDADGNEVLVKEVEDHDEELVRRVKRTAAAQGQLVIPPDKYEVATNVAFDNKEAFLDTLFNNKGTQHAVIALLTTQLTELTARLAKENYGLTQVDELLALLPRALGAQVHDIETLKSFIGAYVAEKQRYGNNLLG